MKITEKLSQDYKESGAVTLAFFGDSVTQGCFESGNGMHGVFDYNAVYHNVLKNKINEIYPSKPVNIINAGIGGTCASNSLNRIDRDVLSHNPDLVVVCFGLNDVNGEISEYINALNEIFDKIKQTETIFMTPNMLNTSVHPYVQGDLRDYAQKTAEYQNGGKMDEFMECAVDTANKHGITVCDCYRKWKSMHNAGVDITELLDNKINHPTRKMHELFAASLLEMIIG